MSDTVYHVTTPDRAEQCLVEGLVPYKTTMCQEKTLEHDGRYDSLRPEHIVATGLTRLNAVYAHPELDVAAYRRNGGWLNRVQGGIAILAVQIANPSNVYVADGLLMSHPYTPSEYWASVMTLQQYRMQERPQFKAPNWSEHNEHRPDRWRSYLYMWPEVLIPGGVEADALHLVSVDAQEQDDDAMLAAM